MEITEIFAELKKLSTAEHRDKMAGFGIESKNALGVKMPDLRKLAKTVGKNHQLAFELWETDVHEAHLLAAMIADAGKLTEKEFDRIVSLFDSWDTCDYTCHLLSKTPFAHSKILQYADNEEVFVKRTSFVLMCYFAVHDKKKTDDYFYPLIGLIEKNAWDERNFVKKAVNWALRQIGKRNENLRRKAIETAERILLQNTKSARWIAGDALRELKSEKVTERMDKKRKEI